MNSYDLKHQQLHPCTVSAYVDVRWPVICFSHDLTLRACQLINTGQRVRKGPERLDTEKLGVLSLGSYLGLTRTTSILYCTYTSNEVPGPNDIYEFL